MDISFFRFNIEPSYWEAVKEFIGENKINETDLRNMLSHTSTNFVIEKCTRFYSDDVIDLKDSYSIQSQRYVNFKDKFDFFYVPTEVQEKGFEDEWKKHINKMIEIYSVLVHKGVKPEDARFVLPITFYSNVKMTLKADKLIDFIIFNLRNSKYDEHREILSKFLEQFDPKYKPLIDSILDIAKIKCEEFENSNKYPKIWESIFEPGTIDVFFHNEPVFESAIGASICYQEGSPTEYVDNFDTQKQEKLLQKILDVKHESVLEHGMITLQMPISRIIHSHIQRHRIVSRTNTSTIEAAKKFNYVIPPDIKSNDELSRIFSNGMDSCKQTYDMLVERGISNENASYVLPNALKIDTILTINIRAIRDILKTRLCQRAQWEVRNLVYEVYKKLYEKSPFLISGIGPSCYIGKCKEGNFCCGKPYIFKDFIELLKLSK